jgi:hypothetical protein
MEMAPQFPGGKIQLIHRTSRESQLMVHNS